MSDTGLSEIDGAVQQTHHWLNAVTDALGAGGAEAGRKDAWHALRAVLAATRDNLPVEDSAKFAAQLPMIVRGLYFEGWRPAGTPAADRHLPEFLERVAKVLPEANAADPEGAARAVFAVIRERVTEGQAMAVKNMLTAEVQALWPDGFDRTMPGNRPGAPDAEGEAA